MFTYLTFLLDAAARFPLFQAAAIIGGTFVLEDAATVLAAMQVEAGAVSLPVALGALYVGIVMGDLGLYGMGRLAAAVPWTEKWIPPHRRDLGHNWLKGRLARVVLVSRFLPGLRLPTYTTCGFLRASFTIFALAAIAATLVWTTLLFGVSLRVGQLLFTYLGAWRWAGAAGFCIVLIIAGRMVASHFNKADER
ncbi:MAG TPA: VTT domain-containing protein [Acetobacteraceae bacterium]|nr:VTT domain-containing protein [Acetobacteraceae bacterium]